MKVILVQSEPITFTLLPVDMVINDIPTHSRFVNLTVSPIFSNNDQPLETFLQSLQISFAEDDEERKRFWDVSLSVCISDSPIISEPEIYGGEVKVHDCEAGGVLETISEFFGGHLKLRVDIFNLTVTNVNTTAEALSINTVENPVQRYNELGGVFGIVESDLLLCKKVALCKAWEVERYVYKGTVAITAILPDDISLTEDPTVPNRMNVNRKILEEEIGWDVTIVPGSGKEIKCHKSFLTARSSVFASMFKDDTKEAQTNIVEIPDITEESFRAFLAYLYCWDIEEPRKKSGICFDIFCAAHKYDVGQLEERMKNILLEKSSDWFDVDIAMKLFLFTRNMDDRRDLKMKAIQVLKSKFSILEESTSYNELFEKDPNAAKDLCKYAFSI